MQHVVALLVILTWTSFCPVFAEGTAAPTSKQVVVAELMEILQPIKQGQQLRDTVLKKSEQQSSSNPALAQLDNLALTGLRLTPQERAAKLKAMALEHQAASRRYNEILREELKDVDTYMAEVLPKLYDKYYSEDEIKELIVFYRSPLGAKYLTTSPKIATELNDLSSQIVQKKVARVMQRTMDEAKAAPHR